jgi:regulator of replication initiation timing
MQVKIEQLIQTIGELFMENKLLRTDNERLQKEIIASRPPVKEVKDGKRKDN